jgi:poly(3-hydroxybutyrate) depolymerase
VDVRRPLAWALALGVGVGAWLGPAGPARAADARVTVGPSFYVAHRPPRPGPWLVVALHSLGHDHREPIGGGWSALADAKGFTVVYPVAPDRSWNAGLCCPPASTLGRDDGLWLARVLADAKRRYGARYVAVAGTSNGGMMAEALVWRRPWLTGRVAVWAGAPEMPAGASGWAGRMLLLHGAGDTTVPWAGTPYAAWCGCLIRAAQATPPRFPAARLTGRLLDGYGHVAPSWWPARAWAFLSQ